MLGKNKKDKHNVKSWNYSKNQEFGNKILFEERKSELLKQFFIFWFFVILLLIILSLYCRSFGIMIIFIPLFLTYVRLSGNNEQWDENFNIIMSNKFARFFLYMMYFLSIIILFIIIYEIFKINFNFHLDFMEDLIKCLTSIFSKY